jgi:periplasmic protein TonB
MEAVLKNFDEQVFENRNKDFGAYFLRKISLTYTLLALAGSVVLFTSALAAPIIYNKYFKSAEVVELIEKVEVDLTEVKSIDPKDDVPPPPPIEVPPPIATVKFLPPVVMHDEEVKEEKIATVEELEEATAGDKDQEGDKGLNALIEDIAAHDPSGDQEQEVLAYVPVQAQFKGGDNDLKEFLSSHLQYPQEALKKGIEGDVWVQFTVNLDGSISDVQLYKGLGHGCDEEAIRVVKKMPASWTPGKVNGESRRSKRKVKISYRMVK